MRAQIDENECRKPFTPSEGVAKGRLMEPMLKAEAEARRAATLMRGDTIPDAENYRNGSTAPGRPANTDGKFPGVSHGETRDQVGAAGEQLSK